MTSVKGMEFYFVRFIAHEKTFMAFSNDFHGILTIPGFIVDATLQTADAYF